MTWTKDPKDPPFDGSAPCPACPVEIRNLHAVVHNYILSQRGGSYSVTTLEDLERAMKLAQPVFDAHFADRMHSHGEVSRGTPGEGAAKEVDRG